MGNELESAVWLCEGRIVQEMREKPVQKSWGWKEQQLKSENSSCPSGTEGMRTNTRGWGWRDRWGVVTMNILTMARNLNFTVSGKHWQFLRQRGASSDFNFKWLLWFPKSEICAVRRSRVESESPAGGAVAGVQEGTVVTTACLPGWPSPSEQQYHRFSLVSLETGQDSENPLSQSYNPVCFLLVLRATTGAWALANCPPCLKFLWSLLCGIPLPQSPGDSTTQRWLSVSKQTGACMSTRLFGCLSMFTCVQLKHGHAGKAKFNGC